MAADLEEDSDDEVPQFQTFDPFDGPAKTWASFDPFDTAIPSWTSDTTTSTRSAPASTGGIAQGPPPGILSSRTGLPFSQPMHVGARPPPGPSHEDWWLSRSDAAEPSRSNMARPPPGPSHVDADALLLEMAALEAENAALKAHMALEAKRAAAIASGYGAASRAAAVRQPPQVVPDETFHTVMLRNLPCAQGFSRDVLMGLLDREGFRCKYDFVYAPMDFHSERLIGFAFANFVNHEEALRAKKHLDGFSDWGVPCKKVCEVQWGDAGMQGLPANVEHYRNSPVMHASVPEQYRPVVLADGVVQAFAPPTKKLRAPRLRHSGRKRR